MGIDWKQVFDFEMTPLMATAVFGSLFAVCAFACGLVFKLYQEKQRQIASKNTSSAVNNVSAEQNVGDGI